MPFDPDVLEVNGNPLQHPGRDELVQEIYSPPREHRKDVRWIMDVKALEGLLDAARRSVSQRVVVHGASLRVRTWRTDSGHEYTTFAIVGRKVRSE